MAQKLNLFYDESLVAELSNKFDLRDLESESVAKVHFLWPLSYPRLL